MPSTCSVSSCTAKLTFTSLDKLTDAVPLRAADAAIPNTCFRCDFMGGKKVKRCPPSGFETVGIEVSECPYQKPYCGLTMNVTGERLAGCRPWSCTMVMYLGKKS